MRSNDFLLFVIKAFVSSASGRYHLYKHSHTHKVRQSIMNDKVFWYFCAGYVRDICSFCGSNRLIVCPAVPVRFNLKHFLCQRNEQEKNRNNEAILIEREKALTGCCRHVSNKLCGYICPAITISHSMTFSWDEISFHWQFGHTHTPSAQNPTIVIINIIKYR